MSDERFHKVKIELKDGTIFGGKVLIDDKEIRGILALNFSSGVESPNVLNVEFIAGDVEITGDCHMMIKAKE